MGVTIVHEFVRLRIRRVPFLGVPREFVRDRARGRRVVAQGWCRQEVRRLTVVMRATSSDTRAGCSRGEAGGGVSGDECGARV